MELIRQNQILFLTPDEQGFPGLYPLPELMKIEHAVDRSLEGLDHIRRDHGQAVQRALDELDVTTTRFTTTQEAYEYYNQHMHPAVCRRAVLMMDIIELCAPFVGDIVERSLQDLE